MNRVYYAGMTALGHLAGNQDAGLIQIVATPGSKKQIGVATNTGKERSGREVYTITISGSEQQAAGEWVLENGSFVQL
jgi:hypothetical protein